MGRDRLQFPGTRQGEKSYRETFKIWHMGAEIRCILLLRRAYGLVQGRRKDAMDVGLVGELRKDRVDVPFVVPLQPGRGGAHLWRG